MKRVLIAAAMASLLLGSSPSSATAEADVRNFSGSAEVTNMLAKGCAEYIRFAGTVRFVYMFVSVATDTGLSNIRFIDANLTGVGETSGATYRLVHIQGGTAWESDDRLVSGTSEVMVKVFGDGQLYTFNVLLHVTVTPGGDVTASFQDVREDGCSA